jgi:uncharacterized protein (DUF58 family)
MLKIFRAEEDVLIQLVLDGSASLDWGHPPKLLVAKRLCAAIGYMALAGSERAQVIVAGQRLERAHEPGRSRGALPRLLRELDGVEARGATNLSRAIDDVVQRSRRPGIMVVASDFFDPGPVDGALARAAAAGNQLVLLQVLSREEVDPPQEGDLALEDAETGDIVEITVDSRAVAAYAARVDRLFAGLRGVARRHQGAYVRVIAGDPVMPAIRRVITGSLD